MRYVQFYVDWSRIRVQWHGIDSNLPKTLCINNGAYSLRSRYYYYYSVSPTNVSNGFNMCYRFEYFVFLRSSSVRWTRCVSISSICSFQLHVHGADDNSKATKIYYCTHKKEFPLSFPPKIWMYKQTNTLMLKNERKFSFRVQFFPSHETFARNIITHVGFVCVNNLVFCLSWLIMHTHIFIFIANRACIAPI